MNNNINISDLSNRLVRLETEVNVILRTREEETKKIINSLHKITDDHVSLLSSIAPNIGVIRTFTEQDILENNNREIETIREVFNQIATYLDSRLSHYEKEI